MNRIAAALIVAAALAPAAANASEPGAPIRVFDAGELALSGYTVVKRLWTQSLRASFWVPEYSDAAAAIAALTAEAQDLGADGVVNLHCVNDSGGWGGGYTCYGLAIKLK
jgi:hypothetical protein